MIKFTYKGIEFTAEQVKALWNQNRDFTGTVRVYNELGEWDYLSEECAEGKHPVLRLLGLPAANTTVQDIYPA